MAISNPLDGLICHQIRLTGRSTSYLDYVYPCSAIGEIPPDVHMNGHRLFQRWEGEHERERSFTERKTKWSQMAWLPQVRL